MKLLTETKTGVVLEFNEDEFRQLKLLVDSVEGKTLGQSYSEDFRWDHSYFANAYDLTSVFGAIQAFYAEKFRINEIRRGLEILENSLRGKDG